MHPFLPSTASRAAPLDWTRLVTDALATVHERPAEPALNGLDMLQSYAAAKADVFTNVSRGERDVKEYVLLLCALDSVTETWPLRIRQLLTVPPVVLQPPGGLGGSLITIPVRTPRGESIVFLYNVSLHHMEEGLQYLARVRADTAVLVNTGGTTKAANGVHQVAVPNQNAKRAFQHFRLGVEAVQFAESVPASPSSPSAAALQQIHFHLPLEAAKAVGTLCAATSKYVYSLSSASTKDKHEVLSTLAFGIAQVHLPPCVAQTSSLQLLPRLSLAAYHLHKAIWYYTSSDIPEMGDALGHVQYADALLRTCDAQWGAKEAQGEREHQARQWWGKRLLSIVSNAYRALPQSVGRSPGRSGALHHYGETHPEGEGQQGEEDGEVDPPLRPATEYPHLYGLVLHGEEKTDSTPQTNTQAHDKGEGGNAFSSTARSLTADVLQVFPCLQLLLHDVCRTLQQYRRENGVVYFAKVATADQVRRDVPDVTNPCAGASADVVPALFDSRVGVFDSLPSGTTLQLALGREEEAGQAQQALVRLLQRVEQDRQRLSLFVEPPAALQHALDALEALIGQEVQWGAVCTLVDAAGVATEVAMREFEVLADSCQEACKASTGARSLPRRSMEKARTMVEEWGVRANAAQAMWRALAIPAGADTRRALLDVVVPERNDVNAFLEESEEVVRDVQDVLTASPGSVSLSQVQASTEALEAMKQRGIDLVACSVVAGNPARKKPMVHRRYHDVQGSVGNAARSFVGAGEEPWGPAPQYAKVEAAVEAVFKVLEEAPLVLANVEGVAAELRDLQKKLVMTSLSPSRGAPEVPMPSETKGSRGDAKQDVVPPPPKLSAAARKRRRAPSPEERKDGATPSGDTLQMNSADGEDGGYSQATVSSSLLRRLKNRAGNRNPIERVSDLATVPAAPKKKKTRG